MSKHAVASLAILVVSACATPSTAPDPVRAQVLVSDADGAQLWRGQASFGVRSAREGRADRVVALPGIGEIQAGLGNGGTCRFVWSKDGLDALTLFDGAACGVLERGRLCFDGARFARTVRDATAPTAPTAPSALIVHGCADENDLLWSKLEGSQPATVGPTSFRQRCRRLPKSKGCELTYVKKNTIEIEHNDSGDDGFALAFDGEAWRACFLERESGRYRIALTLEDACGKRSEPVLEGSSADLDD